MANNAGELNRWVARIQRKLDGMPLTRLDREELEEMIAIIHSLSLRQLTGEASQPAAAESVTRKKKNGGEP